jgi:hypothetical protein
VETPVPPDEHSPAHRERVALMQRLLKRYLPLLGQAKSVDTMSVESDGADDTTIMLVDQGIGITVGWQVERRTLAGPVIHHGWRVFHLKIHPATRWQPEEAEDVTDYEGVDVGAVLAMVGTLICANLLNGVFDAEEAETYAQESTAHLVEQPAAP